MGEESWLAGLAEKVLASPAAPPDVCVEIEQGPARGLPRVPFVTFRAPRSLCSVAVYVEDSHSAAVEVIAGDVASAALFRREYLFSEDGVKWLAQLISGQFTVQRRWRLFGGRVIRGPGGPLFV